MIQVKMTKNINKPMNFFLKFTLGQTIALIVALAIGVATFFLLYPYIILDALMWIIFLELIIVIGFAVMRINGMNLFFYIIKKLKGPEKRYYSTKKGVYDDDNDFRIF